LAIESNNGAGEGQGELVYVAFAAMTDDGEQETRTPPWPPRALAQRTVPAPRRFRRTAIDQTLLNRKPQNIALVDDVLTTGAHFRAACAVVKQVFPDVPIVGLFIARRVPEAVDFEEFEL
jgi:hypothetical protein